MVSRKIFNAVNPGLVLIRLILWVVSKLCYLMALIQLKYYTESTMMGKES